MKAGAAPRLEWLPTLPRSGLRIIWPARDARFLARDERGNGGTGLCLGMNGHTHASFVTGLHFPGRPATPVVATHGWHYDSELRSRPLLWGAMVFSAALHLLLLFGFNRHAPPRKHVVIDDAVAVTLVMPDLKDLEDPEPQPSDGDATPEPGLSVPMLADVPMQVDLSTAFVQEIDYSTLMPQQDLSAAKQLSIPTHIVRTTRIGEGMGKIFDLKDLDRVPEPIVKIAPVVPVGLRQADMHAEVTVGFIVDVNGRVVDPTVNRSSDRRFDDAAVLGISKWKFRPGIKNGRRVNVRMVQPLIFEVKEDN